VYVFKPDNLKKFGQRFGGKIQMSYMPFWRSYEIDSPEDIEICEFYMKKLLEGDGHER
jgi:CMP-N-acetylneuraminic acid synthetase